MSKINKKSEKIFDIFSRKNYFKKILYITISNIHDSD